MAAAAAARAATSSSNDDTTPTFLGASDSPSAPSAAPAPVVAPPVVAAVAGALAAVPQVVAVAASNAKAISELAGVSVDSADKPTHSSATLDLSTTASSNDGSAGAAQLLAGATSTDTATATAPTFKIPTPVESTDFSQGVADRVSFMVDGNISSAKLQVNPAALGPIEVRIALQGAHAQVSFTSHSALTRDALESSAPKLREMLSAQGFGQVSVDVSQGGSSQDRAAHSSAYQAASSSARSASVSTVQSVVSASPRAAAGALDAYA
jgi:flagellar hook-length control protein FliK